MSENTIMVGVGAGIIGLLIGYIAGGPDTDDIVTDVAKEVASQTEAAATTNADQLSAMDGKIAGLEKAMAAAVESQTANGTAMNAKLDEAVASMSARMDTLSKTVTDAGTQQTASIQTALSDGLGKLEVSIGEIAAAGSATAETAVASSNEATTAPAETEPEIEGVRVGHTELLMDGAVRVFVSGIDETAKTARVAVNGLALQTLGGFKDVTFMIDGKPCALLLDDIVQGHVQMSPDCGE